MRNRHALLLLLTLLPLAAAMQLEHPAHMESETRRLTTSNPVSNSFYYSITFREETVDRNTRMVSIGLVSIIGRTTF